MLCGDRSKTGMTIRLRSCNVHVAGRNNGNALFLQCTTLILQKVVHSELPTMPGALGFASARILVGRRSSIRHVACA